MSFKEYQRQAHEWTSQFTPQYWPPQNIYLRLGEEVGELAREINHRFGPKPKKPAEQTIELGDEIADIFFTLICLANSQRIDLDEAWERMMEKYSNRDKDRFAKA